MNECSVMEGVENMFTVGFRDLGSCMNSMNEKQGEKM